MQTQFGCLKVVLLASATPFSTKHAQKLYIRGEVIFPLNKIVIATEIDFTSS